MGDYSLALLLCRHYVTQLLFVAYPMACASSTTAWAIINVFLQNTKLNKLRR
jgi:hypothetical protein